MKKITVNKKELNFENFVKRPATEKDFSNLIKEDTILILDDKPILLYFKFQDDTSEIVKACQEIPYETSQRSGGLWSTSRIFGYDPATGIRKPYCSSTALSFKKPKQHKIITDFGKKIARIYEEYLPEASKNHHGVTKEKIKEEWIIKETPFSSGIIVAGGYLSLPEYDFGLQCADNTLVMFDGQSILHGVTPMKFFSSNAYRYSIVYYTLSEMWRCDDLDGELAKVRNRRNKIENRNAKA